MDCGKQKKETLFVTDTIQKGVKNDRVTSTTRLAVKLAEHVQAAQGSEIAIPTAVLGRLSYGRRTAT